MESAIITLLAILIVISLGGFWRIRTDIADIKTDIARMDAKLDTNTERLDKAEAKTGSRTNG